MVKEILLFKDKSILSSGGHCFQLSKTLCAILVEGIIVFPLASFSMVPRHAPFL